MKRLTAATSIAATVLLSSAASAHHSVSMFDTTKEILIEGEGLGITQALVDGLDRDALKPGTPVVMRANPNRGGWGKQVRIQDVTTQDGVIHPFYAANRRTRTLTPAESIEGHWAPARAALGAAFGAMAQWPVTPAARAVQAKLEADGKCMTEPTPVLSILDELRTIEVGDKEVVLRFDNTGDHVDRIVHMGAQHPANVQPSVHGHSVGRWEGQTLVIDTIGFEPNLSGVALNIPSSAGKHTVERLTLTDDKLRLRYEVTVEDPMYLSAPATLTQQWDHRPDLEFSQDVGKCDAEVANRYKDSVPKQ